MSTPTPTPTEAPERESGAAAALELFAAWARGEAPAVTSEAAEAAGGLVGSVDLREALEVLLTSNFAVTGLTEMFTSPIGAELLPEVAALDMDQGGRNIHKDNLAHSIAVCGQSRFGTGTRVLEAGDTVNGTPALLLLRWGCLLHDVGKAPTRVVARPGAVAAGEASALVTFHNHEAVGAKLTRALLRRLGYGGRFANQVADLVYLSGRTHNFDDGWTDSAVRRFLTDAGPLADLVLDLSRADCTSGRPGRKDAVRAQVDTVAVRARAVRASDARMALRPALTGEEIMAILEIGPGPQVGGAYRFLMGFAERGEVLSKDDAEARLRVWAAARE